MVQSIMFFQRKNRRRKVVPQTSRSPKSHKTFNRNTVKISYCYVKNIGSIISSHNKQVLQPRNKNYGRNWRKKESCALDNKCLTPSIIYEAQIMTTLGMNIKSI